MIVLHEVTGESESGIAINIQLPGRINILGGDSATGKTFCAEFIAVLPGDERMLGSQLKTVVFNAVSSRQLDLLTILKTLSNTLIVIDNADILLRGREELVDFINGDKSNQYLIFSRGINNLDVPRYCRGQMKFNKEKRCVYSEYKEG